MTDWPLPDFSNPWGASTFDNTWYSDDQLEVDGGAPWDGIPLNESRDDCKSNIRSTTAQCD